MSGGPILRYGGELLDGLDLVAEANDATRDDVGAEAAAVDEWAEQSGSGEFLEVGARFGQPAADALDGADPEASADEAVERDAARDDVAACLFPGELDLVEHLRLGQRELVPAPRAAEGSPTCGVAVTGEPAAGERLSLVDVGERRLRVRGDQDRLDRADRRRRAVGALSWQVEVEGRQHPSGFDPSALAVSVARVEPNT
jgi:hypothetical protein